MLRIIPGVLKSAEYKILNLQDVKKLVYVLFFQFANWHLLIIFFAHKWVIFFLSYFHSFEVFLL